MKSSFIQILIASLPLIFLNNLRSQEVTLDGEIYEYATYYVNSFDFNTGATNVQILDIRWVHPLSSIIKGNV